MTAELIAVADGWSVWRDFVIRGAGFPADDVLALAEPALADMTDRDAALRATAEGARTAALAAVEAARDASQDERRRARSTVVRALAKGRSPSPDALAVAALDPVAAATLSAFSDARAEVEQHHAALQAALEAATARATRLLCARAVDPRFREAVRWQNPNAFVALDGLTHTADAHANVRGRGRLRVVANYQQRYSVKNDTIGFFGPVCWATCGGASSLAVPGPTLLAKRTVYLEYWAIDRLAQTVLAREPALRETLAPRRVPTVRLEGDLLHHSLGKTNRLPIAYASVLAACDGSRRARDLADAMLGAPELELATREDVYELLDDLVEKRLVTWRFEIPLVGRPDANLRDLLAAADEAPRARALAALDELEARRAAVERAAGDEPALARALTELDEHFAAATGAAPTQHAGETYGARTVAYEDCRRDFRCELGQTELAGLTDPLVLLLASARWFTWAIAERYRDALTRAYDDLCASGHGPRVSYLRFWQAVEHHFTDHLSRAPEFTRDVLDELRTRWLAILGGPFPAATRRVDRRARDLVDRVRTEFAAPAPGWPSARVHSPDVMFAGKRLDDPDGMWVIGEVHAAWNSLIQPLFSKEHPAPASLVAGLQRDFPMPRVAPAGLAERATRADDVSQAPHDIDLEVGGTKSWRPRAQVLAIGELFVDRAQPGGPVEVVAPDGRRFDVIAFHDHNLTRAALGQFQVLARLPHAPRITIDRLVIARERWTVEPEALTFAHAATALERFAGARAFAARFGIPRLAFYKVPEEPKPCFVDFMSPTYIEILCGILRKASVVHLSEMLPDIDGCWLSDAEGRRYTSELRMVMVDPLQHAAPRT